MKLSQLTPEQKTRLLAELDGWTQTHNPKAIPDWNWCLKGKKWRQWHNLPRYLTSYDAIIPLVQKLDEITKCVLLDHLYITYSAHIGGELDKATVWPMTFGLTPSQLCDAVLVATGKAEL